MNNLRTSLFFQIINYINNFNVAPLILIDTTIENVFVPNDYIDLDTSTIILNISQKSVSNFKIQDDTLLFSASFSGRNFNIRIPCSAIKQIFTREYGLIAEMKHNTIIFNEIKTEYSGSQSKSKKNTFLKVIK